MHGGASEMSGTMSSQTSMHISLSPYLHYRPAISMLATECQTDIVSPVGHQLTQEVYH